MSTFPTTTITTAEIVLVPPLMALVATTIALFGAHRAERAGLRVPVFLAAWAVGLLVLLLICPAPARAATLGVHTLSWHDQAQENGAPYESRTPGVSLRLASGATVGVLRNSLHRPSVLAGWTWSSDEARPLGAAFTAALMTGYPAAPVVPLLAPSVRLRLGERAALRVLLLPKWHPKQGASVVSAAVEWSLP